MPLERPRARTGVRLPSLCPPAGAHFGQGRPAPSSPRAGEGGAPPGLRGASAPGGGSREGPRRLSLLHSQFGCACLIRSSSSITRRYKLQLLGNTESVSGECGPVQERCSDRKRGDSDRRAMPDSESLPTPQTLARRRTFPPPPPPGLTLRGERPHPVLGHSILPELIPGETASK